MIEPRFGVRSRLGLAVMHARTLGEVNCLYLKDNNRGLHEALQALKRVGCVCALERQKKQVRRRRAHKAPRQRAFAIHSL